MENTVVIVGAGPSGLATSACLSLYNIPNVLLEREDCYASLWKKRAYDRVNLHLAKEFCYLPHMPHPPSCPTYMSKKYFLDYIDNYVSHFKLNPLFRRSVESACYDRHAVKWHVIARNLETDILEEYSGRFLVVATGENSEGFIPNIPGLHTFNGKILHSSEFKSGKAYGDKNVLVVGSGNSGMEIAFDLSNYGAKTSVVVRSPVHVLAREMVHLGMFLLQYLPVSVVDPFILLLSIIKFGDMSKYGVRRPANGPFCVKEITGRSPVIDVGTIAKIRSGEIQVLPAISSITGSEVAFVNGKVQSFDAIVFATGYRSTAKRWLKDDDDELLGKDGMPLPPFPNHWKGKSGLYCAGLARKGLAGVAMDAQNIANDIKKALNI